MFIWAHGSVLCQLAPCYWARGRVSVVSYQFSCAINWILRYAHQIHLTTHTYSQAGVKCSLFVPRFHLNHCPWAHSFLHTSRSVVHIQFHTSSVPGSSRVLCDVEGSLSTGCSPEKQSERPEQQQRPAVARRQRLLFAETWIRTQRSVCILSSERGRTACHRAVSQGRQ